MAIIYSVSFWCFGLPSLGGKLIKNSVMQKQLRLVSCRRLAVCPLSASLFSVPAVPSLVFSRHFRRLGVRYHPLPGVSVFLLPVSGWFVWCFPSGRRQLAALPF